MGRYIKEKTRNGYILYCEEIAINNKRLSNIKFAIFGIIPTVVFCWMFYKICFGGK